MAPSLVKDMMSAAHVSESATAQQGLLGSRWHCQQRLGARLFAGRTRLGGPLQFGMLLACGHLRQKPSAGWGHRPRRPACLGQYRGQASGHGMQALQAAAGSINVVPQSQLYVSQPNPMHFGNDPNPPKGTKGWSNENWLKSRFHFQFAEDVFGPPKFGVLRVMNDDLVQPVRGFGTHPHRDMEIITLIVDGELTHKDSMGENETLGRGSIQFMSAGTGVRHSEHNWNDSEPLRFIQSWVMPRRRGIKPNYGSMHGDAVAAEARLNKWAHLVSDVEGRFETPVKINQDCNVYLTELTPGTEAGIFELQPGRQAYLLCVEGEASLAGSEVALQQHDAAELKGPLSMSWVAGKGGAMLQIFEMEMTADTRLSA